MYDEEKEEGACVDINECNAGTDRCDENALCFNEMGTYQCRCKVGYSGDGFTCQSMFSSFKMLITLYFNSYQFRGDGVFQSALRGSFEVL